MAVNYRNEKEKNGNGVEKRSVAMSTLNSQSAARAELQNYGKIWVHHSEIIPWFTAVL